MHFPVANSRVNTRTVKLIPYEYFKIGEKVMGEIWIYLNVFLPERCPGLCR